RNPVGWKNMKTCKFSLKYDREISDDNPMLDYIEARKEIYVETYSRLVQEIPEFYELLDMLKNGQNILIIEVDGPHEESLGYYMEKYNVDSTFIEKDTILVNEKNMNIMLNDPKHPYGHGYCLAMCLYSKLNEN